MQSNAWQRSCVRSPAVKKAKKKAQGAERWWWWEEEEGGEEKKADRGGGGGGGGGRAAAEEASVFPQERLCKAKSTWKSRGMGKWCREV